MEKHCVTIENRENISVSEVKGVDTFDEDEVCLQLNEGGMVIKGRNLHIQKLDLDEGVAVISGEITALNYTKKITDKGLIKKIRK